MNKLSLLFFLIIIISGCSVNRNQPIQDYLTDYELKKKDFFYNDKKRDSAIWIGKEKIHQKRALEIVRHNPDIDAGYNTSYWNEPNSGYGNDTITGYWKQSDFDFKNILFSHRENFKAKNFIDYNELERVYYLSEVLYYNNKRYAAFEMIITDSYIFGSDEVNDVVVFMKKEGNKWILINIVHYDPFTAP